MVVLLTSLVGIWLGVRALRVSGGNLGWPADIHSLWISCMVVVYVTDVTSSPYDRLRGSKDPESTRSADPHVDCAAQRIVPAQMVRTTAL